MERWDYDSKKRVDRRGVRWHFVCRNVYPPTDPEGIASYPKKLAEAPYEVYFRDADRTTFGCVRFEMKKDNPYSHEKLLEKLTNDAEFRRAHLEPDTKSIWRRNWK